MSESWNQNKSVTSPEDEELGPGPVTVNWISLGREPNKTFEDVLGFRKHWLTCFRPNIQVRLIKKITDRLIDKEDNH